MKRLIWFSLFVVSTAVAGPAERIAGIHRCFAACAVQRFDLQVSCAEGLYLQKYSAGPELTLFQDIARPMIEMLSLPGNAFDAVPTADARANMSKMLTDIESYLRQGVDLTQIRAAYDPLLKEMHETYEKRMEAHEKHDCWSSFNGSGAPVADIERFCGKLK